MALTLILQPEYKIDVAGYADHIFTAGTPNYRTLPDAVRLAQERNSVLQSAREAVAFRLAAVGADGANDYQVTRTAALYFTAAGKAFLAFDDDAKDNILLLRAQEGYDVHASTGTWLVSKSDPLITAALHRAEKADRILPAPLENTLRFSTDSRRGVSEYGTSKVVRATIGDLAEPYASFLSEKGYRSGYEWLLTAKNLDQLGVDGDHVEVRRVGVGGYSDFYCNVLYANVRCSNDGGRARGVRKNSTGNNG